MLQLDTTRLSPTATTITALSCSFCLLDGISTPAAPIVFASNREYRAYISICVTTRSTHGLHDPSACRFIAVVTTSPGNARRLQKSIAIGDTRTSTRANGRFLLELIIARVFNRLPNFRVKSWMEEAKISNFDC